MVLHNYSLSLFVRVKCKKHLHPLLMKLKETVHSKSNESFSQGEDAVLTHQGKLCLRDVDGLRELIMDEAYGS